MAVDWATLFVPKGSLVELFIRGSVMYMSLFFIFRFVVRRQMGTIGLMDLLLIVLIADAAQNGMTADYKSIPEGIVICSTLIAWNYLLDWLAFRSPKFRRWLEPPALPLVRNGRVQRKNLRDQLITEEELRSHLREQGVQDIKEVALACMEPDGNISVIKVEPDDQHPPRRRRAL